MWVWKYDAALLKTSHLSGTFLQPDLLKNSLRKIECYEDDLKRAGRTYLLNLSVHCQAGDKSQLFNPFYYFTVVIQHWLKGDCLSLTLIDCYVYC